MEKELYRKLVDDLNSHAIEGFRFRVKGYGHYRDCVLHYIYDEIPSLGKAKRGIELYLAKGEGCLFYGPFKENVKPFHIKGEGKFTLEQIWPRIEILEIIPKEE